MKIRKLGIGQELLKERERKSACASGLVYELLEEGGKEAVILKNRLAQGPVPQGHLRQLASATVDEEFGNITVFMDCREGGGGTNNLHGMCDVMDDHKIPFVVRNLKISDYGK